MPATQKKFVTISRLETQTLVYLGKRTNSIALPGQPSNEVIQSIAAKFPSGTYNRRANMLAAFVDAGLTA